MLNHTPSTATWKRRQSYMWVDVFLSIFRWIAIQVSRNLLRFPVEEQLAATSKLRTRLNRHDLASATDNPGYHLQLPRYVLYPKGLQVNGTWKCSCAWDGLISKVTLAWG